MGDAQVRERGKKAFCVRDDDKGKCVGMMEGNVMVVRGSVGM